MAGGNFPWIDTVGNLYSAEDVLVGAGVCGEVAFTVEPNDGVVKLVGDTLSWSPMLDIVPGDYTYKIVGTLVRYGIQSSVDFTVRALPCETELNIN